MDNVAVALLEGNFDADAEMPEPGERGRQSVKSAAPALPPRKRNTSPVDNSMALVPTNQSNKPPTYDEDDDISKALALSIDDQGPPPLEPIPRDSDLPVYGPVQDPSKSDNRALDTGTDHALRRALEESLNDGRNSLAADVYVELPIEEQVRVKDGRPTALRTSDQNTIFAPPVFQALLAIPQLHTRLKRPPADLDHEESDEGIKKMLEGPKQKCEIARDLFAHAEHTEEAYVDIKPWTGESAIVNAQSPAMLALELVHGFVRGLNLSLPSPDRPLFLPILHDPNSASPPPPFPLHPHQEITQSHRDTLYYIVPLILGGISTSSATTTGTSPPENLVDVLENQVAADRIGFASLPEALVFNIDRARADVGKGKFGFPARVYFDRWMMENRAYVEGEVKKREEEIERAVEGMEKEREKLTKFEGRDTLADMKVCIKHFEENASDGGDEKRKARNERTLEQLKAVLKSIEDRCAEIKTKTEALKAESAELWDQPKLKTIPYDLRAVVIHDGLFGRAHIFSYVRRADKWWKVVDANVTEVTEETVLNDSAGVHLGAGAFLLAYSLAEEKVEGEAEETAKWPRKYRLKTQNANVSFRSRLPPEIQSRLQSESHPVSEGESDEDGASDEFMDAEDMIVVAGASSGEEVVDEVREIIPDDVSMDGANSIN
ncbi:hypothetical protein BDV93DRAFT_310207 [Ceratobasidium sp. AG-I]|nr:hypothetical protein BDV93DRAFT_310207 [Ceratobasidium sp. AG-I]